jgi:hypothetical protein
MSVSQIKSDPTVFTSSPALELSSIVMDPRSLIAGGLAGGARLLGASPTLSLAIGAGAWALQSLFKNIVSGGDHLRPAVFLSAEQESDKIRGGIHSLTIPPVVECLEKMNAPHARNAAKALKDILFYVQHFDYTGLTNGALIRQCKDAVLDLKIGEVFAMPCSIFSIIGGGHCMIALFERKADGFVVTIHNPDPISHYKKGVAGKQIKQTGLQIENVQLEELTHFIDVLAKQHAVGKDGLFTMIFKFYDHVKDLHGKFSPPSSDTRLWSEGQKGLSCSGYSVKCLVRSLLSKEEYKEFQTRFMAQMVKKLSQGMKLGYFWENTPDHHLILKMLKLKLQGCPKRWMDPEVIEMINKKEDVQPSLLGELSWRCERRFWDLLFGPVDFSRESPSPSRIFDGLHPQLAKDKMTIDAYQFCSEKQLEEALLNLNAENTALFEKIHEDKSFTSEERSQLQSAYKDYKSFKVDKTDPKCFDQFLKKINKVHEAMVPYFIKNPKNEFVRKIHETIELIKQNKIKEAKQQLAAAFLTAKEELENLDPQMCVETCIAFEHFYDLCLFHFPETAEELECFAGLQLFFTKYREKTAGSNQALPLDLPMHFSKMQFISTLFKRPLDGVIKGSIWDEGMRNAYKQERDFQKTIAESEVQIPEYFNIKR